MNRHTCTAILGSILVTRLLMGQEYRVVDLGPLGSDFAPGPQIDFFADPGVFRLNEKGQVAYAWLKPMTSAVRAALWLPEPDYGLTPEFIHDLSDLFSTAVPSIAHDINEAGQIVGHAGGQLDGAGEAVLWDLSAGSATLLGFLAGADWSRAVAITDDSDPIIVGESAADDRCRVDCQNGFFPPPEKFVEGFYVRLSDAPSGKHTLGSNDCDASTFVRHVVTTTSVDTIITGFTDERRLDGVCVEQSPPPCDGNRDGVQWRPDGGVPLAMNLEDFGAFGSEGRSINRNGDIVGWGQELPANCELRALLWRPPSYNRFDLHAAAGFSPIDSTRADGLNGGDPPVVVGRLLQDNRALLWRFDGSSWNAADLNDLIPSQTAGVIDLVQGLDVNDNEWILAWGTTADENHTYLLIPFVPNDCPADFDGDGTVGFGDLTILLGSWGVCSPRFCPEDLDFDLQVGFGDLTLILGVWGPCPSSDAVRSIMNNADGVPLSLIHTWLLVGGDDALTAGELDVVEVAEYITEPSMVGGTIGLFDLLSP